MSQAIATAAICLVVAVGIASCSWVEVERVRVKTEFKTACYESGGTWDGWNETCVHAQPKSGA